MAQVRACTRDIARCAKPDRVTATRGPAKYKMDSAQIALRVVNHISAMVAFWDRNQTCVFANSAYMEWFGRNAEEMQGISMKDLLGPIYEKNLPYILGALRGEKQIFERQIPLPTGGVRESIATYTPEIVDGVVLGFYVHVADVTLLRDRERALEAALREKDAAQAEARTLRGLLPICAGCKSIRDSQNEWHTIEEYVTRRTEVTFTHGFCPTCLAKWYPGLLDSTAEPNKPPEPATEPGTDPAAP